MSRKLIAYLVGLIVVIAILVAVDASRPKPIDWRPTYAIKDKIPLGLYVFNNEAPALFKGGGLKKMHVTPYEYFDSLYDYTKKRYKLTGSFLNISEENTLDRESAMELLYFAEHGNTVFLSMKELPEFLLDTLDIKLSGAFILKDTLTLSLTEKNPEKKYYYTQGMGITYFDSLNSDKITVLGYQEHAKKKQPNFIKIAFGSGNFLLHTQPAAFSNYHLLKDDHYQYIEALTSYLPQENVLWYSSFFVKRKGVSDNTLRYILSQPALKWAMWLGIISFVIFVLFNAKRKQRIIPETIPLKNTTVDFAKTIGNLYYQEGNHHTIIDKKIIYFLENLRNEYTIDTGSLDQTFIDRMHLKTGRPVEDIVKVTELIKNHRNRLTSTEADLIAINKAIEKLR